MDIFKYEVREDISTSPMYGTTRLIYGEQQCTTMEKAISLAENYAKRHPEKKDIFVYANQYTCEENVEKHFALQSHIVWATWLSTVQCLAIQKYIKGKEEKS